MSKKLTWLFIILISFASCNKDDEIARLYPIQPTDFSRTTITCGGYLEIISGNPEIISCGAYYTLDSIATTSDLFVESDSIVQSGAFKCVLTNSIPDTIYYIWPYYQTKERIYSYNSYIMKVRTEYALGNSGPAGGLIINLSPDGLSGIEITPEDLTPASWGCSGIDIPNANSSLLGYAMSNTNEILSLCSETNNAASICANYSLNGFDDWYLPTTAELIKAFYTIAQNGQGNFSGYTNYWASSQYSATGAWIVNMYNGTLGWTGKSQTFPHVRAVRYF